MLGLKKTLQKTIEHGIFDLSKESLYFVLGNSNIWISGDTTELPELEIAQSFKELESLYKKFNSYLDTKIKYVLPKSLQASKLKFTDAKFPLAPPNSQRWQEAHLILKIIQYALENAISAYVPSNKNVTLVIIDLVS